MIDDEDLKRMGLFDDKTDIYDVDKDLLYFRSDSEPKKEKLIFTENKFDSNFGDMGGNIGSNCWAVSG